MHRNQNKKHNPMKEKPKTDVDIGDRLIEIGLRRQYAKHETCGRALVGAVPAWVIDAARSRQGRSRELFAAKPDTRSAEGSAIP
jgi:hypothetical protein